MSIFCSWLACAEGALQLIGTASYREALAGGRQPSQKTGTIQVTRRPADRVVPPDGDGYRYGHSFIFQAAPRLAGMLCNLRTEGFPVGDFEAGMDMIVFDRLLDIPTAESVPLTEARSSRSLETKPFVSCWSDRIG